MFSVLFKLQDPDALFFKETVQIFLFSKISNMNLSFLRDFREKILGSCDILMENCSHAIKEIEYFH